MIKREFPLFLSILLLGLGAGPGFATALSAGVARVDLTPPLAMKAALGGYSARNARPAVGVHDRVFAKVLFVTDGTKRHATVTADVLGFPPTFKPALVSRLKELGVTVDELLLLPSHSHTSIDLMALNPNNTFAIPQIGVFHPELLQHTLERIAEAVRSAAASPVPVRLATGRVLLPGWNRNRRGLRATDPDLTVTRIDRVDGKPLAVLVNWTAHPTLLGPQDMVFSGDWPGALQRTLEALIGGDVTVLYFNGAQGDQSPTPRLDEKVRGFEQVEAYGRDVALEAWKLWQTLRPAAADQLAFQVLTLDLPVRARHKEFMKDNVFVKGLLDRGFEAMLEKLFPATSHVHALRLGDLLVVGVPGEMQAELGQEIKRRAAERTGMRFVVIGGLADEWISYILSEKEYERGGYEATVSFYGPRLGPTLVEAAVRAAEAICSSTEKKPPQPGR